MTLLFYKNPNMPLENVAEINRLAEERLALQSELDTLMDQHNLSDKYRQNLKAPIEQIGTEALLSKEPADDALIKIVEELHKAVTLLKTNGPAN